MIPPPADPRESRWAFVALGSNLGDSASVLRRAMDRLQELSTEPLLRSSLWQTEPLDCPPGSPPFVNAVAGLSPRPGETPETLLPTLGAIEWEFGPRARQVRNEPRVLDLDLIAFGREQRALPTLTVPHPRAHLRRFVLEPLCEVAPDLVLPGQTLTVRELLGKLPEGEMCRPVAGPR